MSAKKEPEPHPPPGPEVKVIKASDVAKCPKMSFLPSHYNKDGACKCKRRRKAE